MEIVRGRTDGGASEARSEHFTGQVYGDPVLATDAGVRMGSVFFAPGARTDWHRHERGQILHVTSGQGRVADADGTGHVIRAGDTVWIPPGAKHWHGADADAYLVHYAVSLGTTEWLEPVVDDDYGAHW